ncbi:MAG: 4a-hydroxytetrahydrobiopterin dehydratase [Planctomycetota bacterium]
MSKLTDDQIRAGLEKLEGWQREGDAIHRQFTFPDFASAMAFASKVAGKAEAAQHHPDILIQYSKVTLTLSTHDAGGLTEKDLSLAEVLDGVYSRHV